MHFPCVRVARAAVMSFSCERTQSLPLRLADLVDVNAPANMASVRAEVRCGARSGTVDNRPRVVVAEPVFKHQQLSRKGPFYHLLQADFCSVKVLEWV